MLQTLLKVCKRRGRRPRLLLIRYLQTLGTPQNKPIFLLLYFYFMERWKLQKLLSFATWRQTVIYGKGPQVTTPVDQVERIGPNPLLTSVWPLLCEQTLKFSNTSAPICGGCSEDSEQKEDSRRAGLLFSNVSGCVTRRVLSLFQKRAPLHRLVLVAHAQPTSPVRSGPAMLWRQNRQNLMRSSEYKLPTTTHWTQMLKKQLDWLIDWLNNFFIFGHIHNDHNTL